LTDHRSTNSLALVRRAEQAEASRAALLSAARECFAEQGYAATTVAEVLRRAGMARGALYHYFPGGKDELFAAVYRQVDDELHRRIDALDTSSPLAALRESAAIFLRLCASEDFARITVLEGPRVMAAGSARGSVLGRSYTRMRDAVAAAVDAGELAPADPDVLATAVYGAVRDVGARVAASRGRRRAAEEAVVVVDHLLDGLATTTRGSGPRVTSTRTTATTRARAGTRQESG
jgi:AcrR family transcriptional regulator